MRSLQSTRRPQKIYRLVYVGNNRSSENSDSAIQTVLADTSIYYLREIMNILKVGIGMVNGKCLRLSRKNGISMYETFLTLRYSLRSTMEYLDEKNPVGHILLSNAKD